MRLTALLAGALLCVLFISSADARPRTGHHHRHHFVDAGKMVGCSDAIMRPCQPTLRENRKVQRTDRSGEFAVTWDFPIFQTAHAAHRKGHRRTPSPGLRRVMADGAGRVIGGRPSGCPRAFCGCGASLYLFGKIIPSLNLAANWLRFPRSNPAPGMVAARRGHVFVLVRHIGGKVWLTHDSNSGHHRTRIHPRSIAGFTVVNPRGASPAHVAEAQPQWQF